MYAFNCFRSTYGDAVGAKRSALPSGLEHFHSNVAGTTSGVGVGRPSAAATGAGGRREGRADAETKIHGTPGRYLNRPRARERRCHRAGIVGTRERSVYLTQRTSTTFTTTSRAHVALRLTLHFCVYIVNQKNCHLFFLDIFC